MINKSIKGGNMKKDEKIYCGIYFSCIVILRNIVRLARFVRMTLSFSKSVLMHEACLLLFLHRYQTERAIMK